MNHNLDLDFSKFQTLPIKKRMLFAIQFFEGEQKQEKESFVKIYYEFDLSKPPSLLPGSNNIKLIIKRSSDYQLPSFNKVVVSIFTVMGEMTEQYQLERVTVVAFQKMRDVGDRAEYLLELEYENCNISMGAK